MDNRLITVEALNYDLSPRKTWTAKFVEEDDYSIILLGVFDREITHRELGLIQKGTLSREFFPKHRWHNIFEFSKPDGSFRNYYCNISMPPTFNGQRLAYVDLDIDVVVERDGTVAVLDRDEFEENAAKFRYPAEVIERAESDLLDLLSMIERRAAPFTKVES